VSVSFAQFMELSVAGSGHHVQDQDQRFIVTKDGA
jgi:hypothetical protein